MTASEQLNLLKRIQALSDTGLVYAAEDYDRERYTEIREISTQLMAAMGNVPLRALSDFFVPKEAYPTPKVDVRGLVLNKNNEILMVRERVDGKWTIPGGWADVGYTPSEVVVKEIEEETGLKAQSVRLLAIFDKRCHPHPPEPLYVYKLCFLCKILSGQISPSFDILEAAFFPLDQLPELSENRILKSQIQTLFLRARDDVREVYFD